MSGELVFDLLQGCGVIDRGKVTWIAVFTYRLNSPAKQFTASCFWQQTHE